MELTLLIFTVVFTPWTTLGSVEKIEVPLGETVELKCNISLHHEIFWLRVSVEERPRLLMVAGIKNVGELSEIYNYNPTHFKGCLVGITHVLSSDLASYFCGTIEGKRMEFEEGVHIYAKSFLQETKMNSETISSNEKGASVLVFVSLQVIYIRNFLPQKPFEDIGVDLTTVVYCLVFIFTDSAISMPQDRFTPYRIFAAVLCVRQLGMVVSVFVVHIITWKK